jgi:hypothetical protein
MYQSIKSSKIKDKKRISKGNKAKKIIDNKGKRLNINLRLKNQENL